MQRYQQECESQQPKQPLDPSIVRRHTADAQTATVSSGHGEGNTLADGGNSFHGQILEQVQTMLNEHIHAEETDPTSLGQSARYAGLNVCHHGPYADLVGALDFPELTLSVSAMMPLLDVIYMLSWR